MSAHVDRVERRVDERERGALDSVWIAGEREHRPVVVWIARPIQQSHTGSRGDHLCEPVDDVRPATLADVGNAFDDASHTGLSLLGADQSDFAAPASRRRRVRAFMTLWAMSTF